MPIDPRMVKWDEAPKIDPRMVKWDDEPKSSSSLADAPNAAATGYNKGLLRLAGLPTDTVANVIDLAKAAIGAPYTAITGKPAPEVLQVKDRAKVVGSGDYLIDKARQYAAPMVDAANPDYEGGYIQTAGGGINAIMNPNTRAQLLNQAILGVTSATAGKAAHDLTGNDAFAITASLLPGGAQAAATAATKHAVRGGEAGRREMAQRIADLEAAGIKNPTLGLASGNQLIGGLENLLQNAPGAVGIMRKSRDAAVNALSSKAQDAAAKASPDRGAMEAGTAVQSGAKGFQANAKARQAALYDELGALLGNQTPTGVGATQAALAKLNSDIPGAPNLSKFFQNSQIKAIEDALKLDITGGGPYTPSQLRGALASNPQRLSDLNAALNEGKLPFEAVKKTRTLVGNEIADNSLLSSVPRSKWNPLYGALSEDMGAAANAAGPQATNAFNRATDYTRSSIGRMERIAPIIDRAAPEQSFSALANTLGENVSTFQAVKKSLPEGARGKVAGTVIERLGKATNGVQNDVGSAWSPETFLTNWNKLSAKGKDELLSGFPNSSQVRADVNAVAKATSMMRENSKIWANPSGTSANAAARATLAGIGAGGVGALAGLLNPVVPLSFAGGVGSANLLARGLTSKRVVDAMARPGLLTPQLPLAALTTGLLSEDR